MDRYRQTMVGLLPNSIGGCLFLAVLLPLASCQSSLSLEEAKRIAADLHSEENTVATPRLRKISAKSIAGLTIEPDPYRVATKSCVVEDQRIPKFSHSFRGQISAADAHLAHGNLAQAVAYLKAYISKEDPFKYNTGNRPVPHSFYLWAVSSLAIIHGQRGDWQLMNRYENESSADLFYKAYGIARMPTHFRRPAQHLARMKAHLGLLRGDYEEAEIQTRVAKKTYFGDSRELDILLARSLMGQGRHLEAEKILTKITVLDQASITDLAELFIKQGRFEEAAVAAFAGANQIDGVYSNCGTFGRARAQLILARAMIRLGRWSAAAREIGRVDKEYNPQEFVMDGVLIRNIEHAIILAKAGKSKRALALLKKAENHPNRIERVSEIRAVRGLAHWFAGEKATALRILRETFPELLEDWRKTTTQDDDASFDIWRLRLFTDVYLDALFAAGGKENIDTAYRIVDATTARTSLNIRGKVAARAMAKRNDDKKILSDILTLTNALINQKGKMIAATKSGISTDNLRDQNAKIKSAYRLLDKEIQKRLPFYKDLVNPEPVGISDLRKLLMADEAIVTLHVTENKTYVWAFGAAGKIAFHISPLGTRMLAAKVGLLRVALEPKPKVLGDIPAFDVKTAHELYAALLAPVADGWRSNRNLIVLADGPLRYLPFSLLVTKPMALAPETAPLFSNYRSVPWLTRTHAVSTLPSAGSLRLLRELPNLASKRPFLGFGDPLFNKRQATSKTKPTSSSARVRLRGAGRNLEMVMRAPPATRDLASANIGVLPRLPETADELRQIALSLNANPLSDIFVGLRASEARLKAMNIRDVKVLAFATHGLVPGDLNGLTQPALALTPTSVSGDKGKSEDGLLKTGEILGLKLNADWVVLSACNTGADKQAGADAVFGLGRAFFYAGARALLATNWPVETTSTKFLTTSLFEQLAKDTNLQRSEALRRARLRLIDGSGFVDQKTGKQVFTYAHPIFWAAFSLIGDGGGAAK